ncbi:MAG TPA: metallophosphoesterase [Anaerolineales bacterium]|nr:metallophosphoesterase [Anaerolineales bacterium]
MTPRVESALAQTSDPVFVGAGDIASCGNNQDEATANLLDSIPGTVFTLGDNVYPDGTLTQYNNCYGPTWGRHKNRTRPVPGNHDYHVFGAAGYFDYFGAAAGDRSRGYYSYDLGAWHIIALNSEIAHNAGSAQEQWLRADLTAHPNVCTLAYWHKPRFSSGAHGNSNSFQALWQALYEYRADVILNGHDHTYERFAPQTPNGQADSNGIREFVVGTGGAGLYVFSAIKPNSEVRNNTAHGVLKLTLHATSYDWQFVPIAGQTFTDSGTANCATGAAAPPALDSVGVFRPSNGLLYLKNSNISGFADIAINYGLANDYPVVGDWDGDGDDTIGIYRNGSFYLRNSNTVGYADLVIPFGLPGDQPIAGDWDGDGDDTIGVYRSSTGTFFLRNSNSSGVPHAVFLLGNPGDVGIAGDWDGNGIDTTGVFRPSNGIIFLKNTNTTGFADIALNYGIPGDKPVMGDWDNDGDATIGIYRNGRFYLRNSNTVGFADIVFDLGIPGDMPIAGNWDGIP